MRVNLKGVFYAVSAGVKAMTQGGGGAIVNTSSVGSLIGNPGLPAYAATKCAVNSITESAAVAYAPAGIRVNAIAPGLTMTDMVEEWNRHDPGVIERIIAGTPLGRAATPEEIAESRRLAAQRSRVVRDRVRYFPSPGPPPSDWLRRPTSHGWGDAATVPSRRLRSRLDLDGRAMTSRSAAHLELARTFRFPDYYGKNWSAFKDCFGDFVADHSGELIAVVWDHVDVAARAAPATAVEMGWRYNPVCLFQ